MSPDISLTAEGTPLANRTIIDDDIVASVYQELIFADFETFRQTELRLLETEQPAIHQAVLDIFTSVVRGRTEAEAYQAMAGALFAWRVARGCSQQQAKPLGLMSFTEVATAKAAILGELDRFDSWIANYEKFRKTLGANSGLIIELDKFNNVMSKKGATAIFLLLKGHIIFSSSRVPDGGIVFMDQQ